MIHLDTSFLIRSFVAHSPEEARMRQWLRDKTPLAVSAICWAEFLCGPLDQSQIQALRQILGEPLAFAPVDAERAAGFFNSTGRRRGSLLDCMIAAIALREGATVATGNIADFNRFQVFGLRLEQF